jgi:hypothetical protein
MTMESEARKNQRIACRVEGTSERDPGDAVAGLGLSVNQKKCAEVRKTGRKHARIAGSVRSYSFRGNPG